jgi:hypothetical protein
VFADRIGGDDQAAIVRTQSVTGNGTHTITGVTYHGGDQYVFLRVQQWLEPMDAPDSGVPPGGGEAPLTLSLVVDVVKPVGKLNT